VSIGAPIPGLAYAPLFLLWFGLGNVSAVLLVGFVAAFPIIFNSWTGVKAVKEIWLRSAQSMGADDRERGLERRAGARSHREHARARMKEARVDLVLHHAARRRLATAAGAGGVAALDDEVGDDAVELERREGWGGAGVGRHESVSLSRIPSRPPFSLSLTTVPS
jgi:hypothetical protein